MSAFTFFKALERLSNFEAATKKGRIKIPDYFIKLILLNKTKLLKDQLNKKILKELFLNRHLISKNYVEQKVPNFFLANQKYNQQRELYNSKLKENLPLLQHSKSAIENSFGYDNDLLTLVNNKRNMKKVINVPKIKSINER